MRPLLLSAALLLALLLAQRALRLWPVLPLGLDSRSLLYWPLFGAVFGALLTGTGLNRHVLLSADGKLLRRLGETCGRCAAGGLVAFLPPALYALVSLPLSLPTPLEFLLLGGALAALAGGLGALLPLLFVRVRPWVPVLLAVATLKAFGLVPLPLGPLLGGLLAGLPVPGMGEGALSAFTSDLLHGEEAALAFRAPAEAALALAAGFWTLMLLLFLWVQDRLLPERPRVRRLAVLLPYLALTALTLLSFGYRFLPKAVLRRLAAGKIGED